MCSRTSSSPLLYICLITFALLVQNTNGFMISRSSLTSVIGTSKCSNPNILDIHKSKQKSRSISDQTCSSRLSGSKARALDRNSFEGHKGKLTKRRSMLSKAVFTSMIPLIPFQNASAQTDDKFDVTDEAEVLVSVTGDVKSLFNEGRAKELQGNIAAAQRIYSKVTKMAPKVCSHKEFRQLFFDSSLNGCASHLVFCAL